MIKLNPTLDMSLAYLKNMSHISTEGKTISYSKFEEIIGNDEVANKNFARAVPKGLDQIFKDDIKIDPDPEKAKQYNIIRKAYNLGLVDFENNLVTDNLTKVETDYSQLAPVDKNSLENGFEVYDNGNPEYKATIEAYKEEIGFVSYKKTEENKDLIDKAMKSYNETAFKIIMEMDSQELALDNLQDQNTEKDYGTI